MTARTQATHKASFGGATHRGTFAACAEYPCEPHRDALAYLRENDPRTPVEDAALAAVNAKRWIPVHAADWNTAIVLILSRAGLLRDADQEKRDREAAQAMGRIAQRESKANTTAITHLDALAEQAADRLDAGDDPREVAAWIRQHREAIQARREQGRSFATAEASA